MYCINPERESSSSLNLFDIVWHNSFFIWFHGLIILNICGSFPCAPLCIGKQGYPLEYVLFRAHQIEVSAVLTYMRKFSLTYPVPTRVKDKHRIALKTSDVIVMLK